MSEMTNYILRILQSDPIVWMSWGVENITEIESGYGICFHVSGFKYQGEILVKYNDGADAFDVELVGTEEIIESVYLDELAFVIDSSIERTDNYKERICQEYGILADPVLP